MSEANPFVATVIILEDPGAEERGYDLTDREFVSKYPGPVKGEGAYNGGKVIEGDYYVVTLQEYVRVVPEPRNDNANFTEEIYIPKHLATMSFKPTYAK